MPERGFLVTAASNNILPCCSNNTESSTCNFESCEDSCCPSTNKTRLPCNFIEATLCPLLEVKIESARISGLSYVLKTEKWIFNTTTSSLKKHLKANFFFYPFQ